MKRTLLLLYFAFFTAIASFAYDFSETNSDGKAIYYKINSDGKSVSVTYYSSNGPYNSSAYSGSIVIPESVTYLGTTYSVTKIGDSAFYDCRSLTSVILPNSVTEIANIAFKQCYNLESVNLPNSLTKIGAFSFEQCESLTSVIIPKSVTSVSWDSFSCCKGLIKSAYPSSISDPFSYGVTIGYPKQNSLIDGNGIIWNADKSKIYYVPLTFEGSFIIPNTITSIGDYAFYNCSDVKTVIFGNSVVSIGESAFKGCNLLYKLVLLPNTPPENLANSLSTVNNRISYVANTNYNNVSNLGRIEELDFLSSIFEVNGVRYVPLSPSERTCVAIDCTYNHETDNIKIDHMILYKDVPMTVKKIYQNALRGNWSITALDIETEGDIEPYAFAGCGALKTLILNNDGAIGERAFADCLNLEKAFLGEKIADGIGQYAFFNCPNLKEINLPNWHTVLKPGLFEGCSSLSAINLPTGLLTISNNVFAKCWSLGSIIVPETTTSIGSSAFQECRSLRSFTALNGMSNLNLGSTKDNHGAFYDCPLEEVTIGRNLLYDTSTSGGYSPFYRSSTLRKVTLTNRPTEVFNNEFYGCTALTEVEIGDGVTSIGKYAFSGCSALQTFSFGNSVKTIGEEAFSDCTALTSLYAEPDIPPTCGKQALDDINKWECTLYVKENSLTSYRIANQWKDFFFIETAEFDAALEEMRTDVTFDGSFMVYSLNGTLVKARVTADEVQQLPAGIYIVNGRKVMIR